MSHLTLPDSLHYHEFNRSYVTVPLDRSSTAGTVVLVILMFSGLIFNAVVITSILRTPSLRTISNGLMLQLSIADCILSGVIGPVLLRNIINGAWLHGMDTPSEWQASASMGACYESIMSLTLIALHRYAAVVQGKSWTRNRTLLYCSPTWILSLLLMSYSYFGVGEFDIEPGHIMAGYSWYKRDLQLIPAIHSMLTLIVCAVIIAVSYYQIYIYVAAANEQLNASLTSKKLTAEQKTKNKSQNKEIALAQRMITIIACFFACWTLYTIQIFYCLVSGQPQPVVLDQFATILGHANSMVNPLLFTYLDKRVQAACINLITCKPANYVRKSNDITYDLTSQHSSQEDTSKLDGLTSTLDKRTTAPSNYRNTNNPGRASFAPSRGSASYNVSPNTGYINKRASTGVNYVPPKFLSGFPATTIEEPFEVQTTRVTPIEHLRKLSLTIAGDAEAQLIEQNNIMRHNAVTVHINEQTPEVTRRRVQKFNSEDVSRFQLTQNYPNPSSNNNNDDDTVDEDNLPADLAPSLHPPLLDGLQSDKQLRSAQNEFSVVINGADDNITGKRDSIF